MRIGKISESVLKRSVLRYIKTNRDEVIKGAGVGEDCAFLVCQGEKLAVSTQTVTIPTKQAGYLAIMAGANNLMAAGAEPIAATLAVTLPAAAEEAVLKEIMKRAQVCCEELGIQIAGGHTQVSRALISPVVSATVTGAVKQKESVKKEIPYTGKKPVNMDIVISKWIGLEGTFLLAEEKEEELRSRYPMALLYMAKECGTHLCIRKEAAAAWEAGVRVMHDASSGGVFGALWELSRKLETGFTVDLKKIPVKQETIEVCEFYGLNPYQLLSGGALLMVAEDGSALVRELEQQGVPGTVIGHTISGNDKLIFNQEEIRYLEPAAPDEIGKVHFLKGGEA